MNTLGIKSSRTPHTMGTKSHRSSHALGVKTSMVMNNSRQVPSTQQNSTTVQDNTTMDKFDPILPVETKKSKSSGLEKKR